MPDGASCKQSSWCTGWRAACIALFAGASLPLAFAPVGWFPLAIIAPAVLFYLCYASSPRQALILGYVFGVGFFGVGVSWVAISFYRFGGMSGTLSVAATVLFVLFLSLFPSALAWLSRRVFFAVNHVVYFMLVMPALWVLFEWVRGWIFTGFPWLNLGYSQTDSPLGGLAPIIGVYGISWAVVLSAGILLVAWWEAGRHRLLSLGALILLWGISGLLWQLNWSKPNGEPMTASLIQGNVPQNLKWRPDQRAPTIDLYTRLSRERWDRDLVIWPETALPAYLHQAEVFLQGLAREARDNGGATLLVGLPVMSETDHDQYYNGVVRVGVGGDGEGMASQVYRKSHLVPFGEYIPFESVLGRLLEILQVPMANFSRGATRQPLLTLTKAKGEPGSEQKIAVSICYEDAFGEEVIRGLPEATLLVNVSNDAWFGHSIAPQQHLQIARMRALEAGRFAIRATNTGISAFIGPDGSVLEAGPQFRPATLTMRVEQRRGSTPFAATGNRPLIILCLLVTGVLWLRTRPS